MGRARPDQNYNFSLIAVSNGDGNTPVELWADPTTHALVTSGGGAGGGGTQYVEGVTTTPATGTLAVGRYMATSPTLTDGQLYGMQLSRKGELSTFSPDTSTTGTISTADAVVGAPGGAGATVTGASTAGSLVALQTQGGDSSWIMQFSGTFGGTTIYFEGSLDSTTGTDGTWINVLGRQTGVTNTVLSGSAAAAGVYRGNTSGWTWIRARAVGGAGITVAVKQEISSGTGAIFLNASIPAGTNLIGNTGINDGTTTASVIAGDSGNNALAVAPSRKEVSFTTTTVQAVASTDVSNYRWVSVQITAQGTSSTITFQGSNDNTNWVSVALVISSTVGTTAPVVSTTAASAYVGPLHFRYFRLNVTGISALTTSGVVEFFSAPSVLPLSNSTSVTQLSLLDNADAVAPTATVNGLKTMSAIRLFDGTNYNRLAQILNATNSVGTGIAAAGLVGQFDDVSPTAITENQFGNIRMSTNRNLYGTIRDAAGNERGTNVDASNNLMVNLGTTLDATNDAIRIAGGLMPTGSALNTYSVHLTTNTTTTPTSSTAYISSIAISTEVAGTTSTVTIQDKQGTPLKLVNALTTVAASTAPQIYNFQTPLKMGSGIDIITAGAVASTVDVWINYYV